MPTIRVAVANLETRLVTRRLQTALAQHPVVLLQGPRHSAYLEELTAKEEEDNEVTGAAKLEGPRSSALVARTAGGSPRTVLDLNLEETRQAALADPALLIRSQPAGTALTILEAQRAPQLLAAIKAALDQSAKTNPKDKAAGRFLLTASVDLTRLPDNGTYPVNVVPPALINKVGLKAHAISLLPPSQRELLGTQTNWLDAVFAGQLGNLRAAPGQARNGEALVETVLKGGFLEAVSRIKSRSRHAWLKKHLQNQLVWEYEVIRKLSKREIKAGLPPRVAPLPSDLQEVRKYLAFDRPARLIELLEVLASHSGGLCNFRQFGLSMGFDSKTAERYTQALELMFLVQRLPALGCEDGTDALLEDPSRMVKADKLHFVDSGQLADLLDQNAVARYRERAASVAEGGSPWSPEMAQVLESFVFGELKKHAGASAQTYRFAHYRDHDQQQVDMVVANAEGQAIGIDVVARDTVKNGDFSGLKILAGKLGKNFKLGIILYDGSETRPGPAFDGGGKLWMLPVSSLWGEV
jgi:uncharacterized protein